MTLYAPFGQHVFVGIFGVDSQATAWVLAREWDTNGDGTGIPRSGMMAMIGETEPYGFYVYKEDGVGGGAWEEMAEVGGSVTSHDMGGSSHNADTLADISTKCSDDDLVGVAEAQTLTHKTLTTPTIGDMTNAGHDHSDAAGGGTIAHSDTSGQTATDHHDNANDPTSDEKGALDGTGTPSGTNKFVTNDTLQAGLQGLAPKATVVVLADSNQTLSGALPTIDGIALAEGDRVLLTNQTSADENGIWEAHAAGWSRPGDFDTGDHAAGAYTFATEGTDYHDQGWVCTTDAPSDVIDTDNLAFEQFTGAGQITAGTGLTKDGDTLHVGDGTVEKREGINFTADDIAVAYDGSSLDLSTGGAPGNLQIADDGVRRSMLHGDVAGDGIAQAGSGALDADPANATAVSGHTVSSESGVSVVAAGIFSAVTYAGNPNGNVTAPGGMICRDTTGGITYVNTDGATAWSVI